MRKQASNNFFPPSENGGQSDQASNNANRQKADVIKILDRKYIESFKSTTAQTKFEKNRKFKDNGRNANKQARASSTLAMYQKNKSPLESETPSVRVLNLKSTDVSPRSFDENDSFISSSIECFGLESKFE